MIALYRLIEKRAMSRMEVCLHKYFWWCGYFRGLWVSFDLTDELSVRVTKITSRISAHELTAYLSLSDLFLTH